MMWLLAAAALAQVPGEPSLDVELFRPMADPAGTMVVESAETLGHLQVGVGVWGNYSEDSVVLNRGDQRIYVGDQPQIGNDGDGIIDRRSRVDVQFGVGFFGRLSLTANIPLLAWQEGYELGNAFDSTVPNELVSAGIGDPRITPKVVLLDHETGSPLAIAVLSRFTIPLGTERSFVGEGEFTAHPMAVLEFADASVRDGEHWVRLTLNGGYFVRQAATVQNIEFNNAFTWGASVGFSPGTYLEIGADIIGQSGSNEVATQPIELLPWMKFRPDRRVTLTVGGGIGLLEGVGAPDYRVIAGASFQPSFDPAVRDRDRDGIVDKLDQCVFDPEDIDGFEDEDGCPEFDNDRDGIIDGLDQCPSEPEDMDGFEDEDGCPENDNDGDGIVDSADRCPNQAETVNGYQDEDGCPDERPRGDSDGDGFLDENDQCPLEAEDFDGYRDQDGCPDVDNDSDGVPDSADSCPMDPEDLDGVQDTDGCPETDADADSFLDEQDSCPLVPGFAPDGCPVGDTDGDGILDDADACPFEAETMNAFEDDDGCPDEAPPRRVIVREDRIEITETIFFATNRAEIQPISLSLIDEIAMAIRDNPRIGLVEVQGHTDADGSEQYNQDLSQRRADSVRQSLIQRDIEPERLRSVGFGESVPIADNVTREGKATKRRVEFHIVE